MEGQMLRGLANPLMKRTGNQRRDIEKGQPVGVNIEIARRVIVGLKSVAGARMTWMDIYRFC